MSSGTIKVAEHQGVTVIKMEGDVRLTLCLSFDDFIEDMLSKDDFCSVLFDLTEAEAIDSTTLGLMAKIAITGRDKGYDDPVVITRNPNIKRILRSMGFADIFQILDEHGDMLAPAKKLVELKERTDDEKAVQARILEAHKVLMNMNEENRNTFKELVDTLEQQS